MEKIINRDIYLSRLIDKKENGLIKVITGIRRCGKSYLLFYLFRDYLISSGVKEEQIISIALDDDICEQYRNPDGFFQRAFLMVYRTGDRMAVGACYEHQSGSNPQRLYSH